MFYTCLSSHCFFPFPHHLFQQHTLPTPISLLEPLQTSVTDLLPLPLPHPGNDYTIPRVEMWLTVINAISHLLQTRSHAVRDTQCSEWISLWPASWQQKLRIKMAALLGNKWTFLTRSPHAAPHWTEGNGTRRLLQ